MSMFDLTGKVALVTGGSMGLGLTFTDVLAEHGADIAITARSAELLEENAKGLRERHGRTVTCHAGDVTNENDVRRVVAETIEQHGRIDILVNNAGISDLRGLPSEWSDHETFRRVVDVDLFGVWAFMRECGPHMLQRGSGSIINISSISRNGNVGQTNYCATKAGVVAMAEVWAKELARYGIRTGTIAPGFCATEILSAMSPETLAKVTAPVPLKRLGQPAEIASTAVFIAENDFFSGRCIGVDGGLRF